MLTKPLRNDGLFATDATGPRSSSNIKAFKIWDSTKTVERRQVLNSLIINSSKQKYRRTVTHGERGTPMCYVICRIWLALTRQRYLHIVWLLKFRWEILNTGPMYCDGCEVRQTAVWWSKLTASIWAASTTHKMWNRKFGCQTTRIPDMHHSNINLT